MKDYTSSEIVAMARKLAARGHKVPVPAFDGTPERQRQGRQFASLLQPLWPSDNLGYLYCPECWERLEGESGKMHSPSNGESCDYCGLTVEMMPYVETRPPSVILSNYPGAECAVGIVSEPVYDNPGYRACDCEDYPCCGCGGNES